MSVQYAVAGAEVVAPRTRMRRWVQGALAAASRHRARPLSGATLAFRFVDDDEGRALNRGYRHREYATNVLTFAYGEADVVEADIVVCLPVVEREAREQGKAVPDHCAHLVVHGTLHACGFDHETDDEAGSMEAVERDVLRRFGIADPYAEAGR